MNPEIEAYIRRLLSESTPDRPLWNVELLTEGKKAHWNYIDGCMITALLELGRLENDSEYFDFAERFIDYYIDENGDIRGYDASSFNLDDINEGRVLFELYEKTGKEKYRRATEQPNAQLASQPRTYEGSFWHKQIYPNQVWLDGLYMAQVFRTLYALRLGDGDLSDVLKQFACVREHMYCRRKGLYFHAYDASKTAFWADPRSGCSKNFWLRAIGWYSVALIDIIELSGNEQLTAIFRELMEGIARYADEASGMYWQVVDKGGRKGNYLETSGSSMIAYSMLKGARLGILDKKYADKGLKTFDGIRKNYLSASDGTLNLGGICLMAGVGPDSKPWRDGSYEYYISEPIVENDAKGVAPFLLCYTEVRRLG